MVKKASHKLAPANDVEKYITKAPKAVRGKLRQVRAAILAVAPGAIERTDYFQWPGYSLDGAYDYAGMFAWFSFRQPNVRLHVRPPVIQNHRKDLADFETTKAVVFFPADGAMPTALVKKLTKASIRLMKDRAK
jgi:uncharacterized protein YdhG (YjbR/CyaY superfamily)